MVSAQLREGVATAVEPQSRQSVSGGALLRANPPARSHIKETTKQRLTGGVRRILIDARIEIRSLNVDKHRFRGNEP